MIEEEVASRPAKRGLVRNDMLLRFARNGALFVYLVYFVVMVFP